MTVGIGIRRGGTKIKIDNIAQKVIDFKANIVVDSYKANINVSSMCVYTRD